MHRSPALDRALRPLEDPRDRGLATELVYGWLRGDMPLMVANAVMVVLTGAITVMKLRFEQRAA